MTANLIPDPLKRPPTDWPMHWGCDPLHRAALPLTLGVHNPVSMAMSIGRSPPPDICALVAHSASLGVFGSLKEYFLSVARESEHEPMRLIDCGRFAIMGEIAWQVAEGIGLDPASLFIDRQAAASLLDYDRDTIELGDPWFCNIILDRYSEQLAAYRAGMSPEDLSALLGRGGSLLAGAPSMALN